MPISVDALEDPKWEGLDEEEEEEEIEHRRYVSTAREENRFPYRVHSNHPPRFVSCYVGSSPRPASHRPAQPRTPTHKLTFLTALGLFFFQSSLSHAQPRTATLKLSQPLTFLPPSHPPHPIRTLETRQDKDTQRYITGYMFLLPDGVVRCIIMAPVTSRGCFLCKTRVQPVRFRHVRGEVNTHTRSGPGQFWVNTKCLDQSRHAVRLKLK
ncbi:hypothetical protein O3P69_007618 [Scylla paramamosain]|uniref:Uncharacterized protein n=1 Tax=Scylla paramamosain TaxID=85552 RepID=A0AAW0UXU0_SCYPA